MAFKMKGMSFGKGTQYKSPQLMKAESAMKMKKEAAMKMAKNSAMDMAKKSPMDMAKKSPMDMAKDPMKMKKTSAMKKDDGNIYGDGFKVITSGPDTGKVVKTKPKVKAKPKVDKFAEAKKKDPNLSKYVAERKKHKKGSPEYNALQNKINKAYGVSKRHGEKSIETKSTNRTNKITKKTPGIGTKDYKYTKDVKGNIRKIKTKEKDLEGNVTSKTKQKFDADKLLTKSKTIKKTDTKVTKTKKKIGKDEKVKTRKRGGTGIGAAIKTKLAERKARRAKKNEGPLKLKVAGTTRKVTKGRREGAPKNKYKFVEYTDNSGKVVRSKQVTKSPTGRKVTKRRGDRYSDIVKEKGK